MIHYITATNQVHLTGIDKILHVYIYYLINFQKFIIKYSVEFLPERLINIPKHPSCFSLALWWNTNRKKQSICLLA